MAPGTKVTVNDAGEICVKGNTQTFTRVMNNEGGAFQKFCSCGGSKDLSLTSQSLTSWETFMSNLELGGFWKNFKKLLADVSDGEASSWNDCNGRFFKINSTESAAICMIEGFLKHLKKDTLFNWFNHNIADFVKEESTEKHIFAKIEYGLVRGFFTFNPTTEMIISKSDGDAKEALESTITFSTEDFLKRLTLLNHGRVMLQPTDMNDEYKVCIIQTHDAPPEELDLVMLIDVSYSMGGEPIETVKRRLPEFLRKFCAQLKPTQKVNLKVVYFSDQEYDHYEQQVTKKDEHSGFQEVSSRATIEGSTNLTVFEKHIWGKNGILVGFTDGQHSRCEVPLGPAFESMEKEKKAKPFREPFVFPVGASADDYFFTRLSGIFAGCTQKADDMNGFFDVIKQKLPQMTQGSEAFQMIKVLNESCITVRVPRAQGIYDTGHTACEGDSVRDTGTGHTVTARKTFVDTATGMDDAQSTRSGEDLMAPPAAAATTALASYVFDINYRIVKIGNETQFQYVHQIKDASASEWKTLKEPVTFKRVKKAKEAATPAKTLRLGKDGTWHDSATIKFLHEHKG